ncbi:unnamed protein product [Rotaria socialis]|uniref:Uncharacterized protein n=1 Tax=Rotaria socialis TaxID=392032 RepID=A0A817TH08_9BILA|nr:unnamed protein product [Rotaria socialis]CAF3315288.1 unnamed protein product [Rotaria socialis]CAF3396660.1 unnamed protein product [Rotaria socialis]CAF3426692.1 unnamed protein product [Rotaria socialis]CAF3465218.1 unnamed protein product [Rotaria socialis]
MYDEYAYGTEQYAAQTVLPRLVVERTYQGVASESRKTENQRALVATSSVGSSRKTYRQIVRIHDWKEEHVVQFFIDSDLTSLLPILKGIDGKGLLELYRIYQQSPDRLYKMFSTYNDVASLGSFFKLMATFRNYIVRTENEAYY